MREKILNTVKSSIHSLNLLLDKKIEIEEQYETTTLYGASGDMDSLSLVNLIVTVEEAIENEFGTSIILANEKALSQKNSPFSTVWSLVNYIESLLKQDAQHA